MNMLTIPRTTARTTSYGTVLSLVLVSAFALSATHTVYGYVTGIGDPSFTVTTPAAWLFYAAGFGSAALARRESKPAQVVLLAYLGLLVLVAVFWYPTTFVARQQTVFGWFENDVYTGLLMIGWLLTALRLRGVSLTGGDIRA
jgi:hypothetical protein